MREIDVKNAIIFCNRKKDVGIVYRSLQRHGFNVGALHGDLDQHQRTATLDAFRNGTIAFLAASDVAARGLDIPDVSHIFNYDVPIHPEDYIHRIGRTGRAGREGFAAMLVTPKDHKALKAIERMLKQEIPWIDGARQRAERREMPRRAARTEIGNGNGNGASPRQPFKARQGSIGAGRTSKPRPAPASSPKSAAKTANAERPAQRAAPAPERWREEAGRASQRRTARTSQAASTPTAFRASAKAASVHGAPPERPQANATQPPRVASSRAWAITSPPS